MTAVSRRGFLGGLGASLAVAGCKCPLCGGPEGRIAVQLYSLKEYIMGLKDRKTGAVLKKGIGIERALEEIAKIGYRGVEFHEYDVRTHTIYGLTAKELAKLLKDNGLEACGVHVTKYAFSKDCYKQSCDFIRTLGSDLLISPGGGNFPSWIDWSKPQCDQKMDDFIKQVAEDYNVSADLCATYGCKVGLHNHAYEFRVKLTDGTPYWDYFFSHTDPRVQMEQDIGWTTCAGYDPCEQWRKYPHRSETLHAKENGMGPGVRTFDGILGQPGQPGAKGVDWNAALAAAEADGVKWWVVECERHFDDFTAVAPSYTFLKSLGLN